ncbi:MAG: GIY-YIG nuclease family protein, partial [Gemmatimonadales bacterium]
MPIKLKPGIVYFLRERDFRTGAFTDYCKIGLVAGERTTEQRVKEHQTGNPRQIHEEVSVETPAVDDLETYMHGRFAPWRVSGEWFHLTADRLQEAIGEARSRSGT